MVVFLVTNFAAQNVASFPAAVVYENDPEAAKAKLKLQLQEEAHLLRTRPMEQWTVTPLTPLPNRPRAIIITSDYQPPRSATELRGNDPRSTL